MPLMYGNPGIGQNQMVYGNSGYGMIPQGYSMAQQGMIQAPAQQYMINVDGEIGARAWQMPNDLLPNTVIPLWDVDGVHVYFRSVDAYGRLNPLRKGRVVFEDEPKLPQGFSGEAAAPVMPDMTGYATKEDMDELKKEIRQMSQMINQMSGQNRQNGSNRPQQATNRGGVEG